MLKVFFWETDELSDWHSWKRDEYFFHTTITFPPAMFYVKPVREMYSRDGDPWQVEGKNSESWLQPEVHRLHTGNLYTSLIEIYKFLSGFQGALYVDNYTSTSI